jgi:23S rRNA pseudouridine2605 synthase
MPAERVQKLIARAGIASRRGADSLVAEGRVRINERVARPGDLADPERDAVTVDDQPLAAAEPALHLAVHKPSGYLSSVRDERGRPSVLHLLADAPGVAARRIWPAGRLDADSEGLLIVTNDGPWANRVLHPRYGIEREYAVLVGRAPDPAQLVALLDGVELEDGPARLLSARAIGPPREVRRAAGGAGTWLRVRVGEGRKREVRRLFEAVGLRVERLVRTRIGPLTLRGLRSGAWRELTPAEVSALGGRPGPPARTRSGRGPLAVAIDGPSGAGKSTVGFALAERLGANFVDTGLMYRALTLAALDRGVPIHRARELGRLAKGVRIEVRRRRPDQLDRRETVLLDGRDVTQEARTPRIDRAVSEVSRHAMVRSAMLQLQRDLAAAEDTVMVGRDIGTVVLPDADLKVYLTASAEVRAARRATEMGRPDRLAEYRAEIEHRDAADSGRSVAPLRKAPGALVLDTGVLGVEACVEAIVEHLPARQREGALGRAG